MEKSKQKKKYRCLANPCSLYSNSRSQFHMDDLLYNIAAKFISSLGLKMVSNKILTFGLIEQISGICG